MDEAKGGDFFAMISEDHRKPVYAVAFWPRRAAGELDHLAVAGSCRASVYAVGVTQEGQKACEVVQVYVDNDESESFFCCSWSWNFG